MKNDCTGIITRVLACLFAVALTSRGGVFTNLYAFSGSSGDGAAPYGVLLKNGLLYGAAQQGGSSGNGQLFRVATNGMTFTNIHNFDGMPTDGSSPNELLQAGDMIYGTTFGGGNTGNGVVFKMNTNGAGYTVLRHFQGVPEPQFPQAGLIINDATLYGTSYIGGSNGLGTVFKIDTNGANLVVLHNFTNNPDGMHPEGRLVLNETTLYGTTYDGGSNGVGTVFKINTNGAGFSVIYHFSNAPAAMNPQVGLTLMSNALYGVTTFGGISNIGTVFQLSTNGTSFAIIHSFTNNEAGLPASTLVAMNNLLYGTGQTRGTGQSGAIFQVGTNGANFTVLKNFTNTLTGSNPGGPLVLDGGFIYGTTSLNGPNTRGTIYQLLLSPLITAQPQSVSVTNGYPASFTIGVSDENPVSYQWYFNTNTLLAGQTGAMINFGSVSNGNAGTYTVAVLDNGGSATSSPALLTVTNPPPTITLQPLSATITNGSSITFTSAAAGGGTLFYQWLYRT
ncbi:MAG: hypothetical protein JF609_03750, partial [Verrucomicrobia bacterium]|nr:hypothetical protein [Verrucomicrobiota bacterium]